MSAPITSSNSQWRFICAGLLFCLPAFLPAPAMAASPDPQDDNAITNEGQRVIIDVLQNDFNNQVLTVTDWPNLTSGGGIVTKVGELLHYTPATSVIGSDSFQYTVLDLNNGQEATATVNVTILAVPSGLAFPANAHWETYKAEGFGAYATGGRGGSVYRVYRLQDDNSPSSLRYGVNTASGPTIIVFNVSGTIYLTSPLTLKSNMTIAGETAPPNAQGEREGVTVRGNEVRIWNLANVIVRFVRIRNGFGNGQDSLSIDNAEDIMIDHVSMQWGKDGTMDISKSNNVTCQWSIIAEGLLFHSCASYVSGETDLGTYTLHHNLYANSVHRNPYVAADLTSKPPAYRADVDLVNNVIYGWDLIGMHIGLAGNPGDPGDNSLINSNVVGNYFIAGTDPNLTKPLQAFRSHTGASVYLPLTGVEKNLTDLDQNVNHAGSGGAVLNEPSGGLYGDKVGRFNNYPSVSTSAADIAYINVLDQSHLNGAGASYPIKRDVTDIRIVNDVLNRTGSIKSQVPPGE